MRFPVKNFAIGILFTIAACIACALFFQGLRACTSRPESVSDVEKIESDRDSLINVIQLKTDTLAAIRGVKESLEFELKKAAKERKEQNQKYEGIHYISYPTDSARMAALAELYHSFKSQSNYKR